MIPLLVEAKRRLEVVLGLGPDLAGRAVSEMLDALDVDVDGYIAKRHAELKAEGVDNAAIYARIAAELPELRLTPPRLTERQIRRRLYG